MVLFQISDYVEHNDAILLVIVPAAQAPEISSSRALKLAKEFDADGEFLLTLLPCCVIVLTYDVQIQDGYSRDMDLHMKKRLSDMILYVAHFEVFGYHKHICFIEVCLKYHSKGK